MSIDPFTAKDFQVFERPGFTERMAGIRRRIQPKLEGLGAALALPLARAAGAELFPHVAKHARRTVNPPDDTWVAFGPDRRGYKKAPHFKVAVSRHAVRFLFEIGPEFAGKPDFAKAWKREGPRLARSLARAPGLGWFRSEHDEEPAVALADLDAERWTRLGEELTRTRDGQLVLGRRVGAREVARWKPADYEKVARETFTALGECFKLT